MKSMQFRLIRGFLFLLCLCTPYCVYSGQTYYISTQGSNSNSGSINSPWGSLEFAVTVAKAGDTIIIRGGTYIMGEVFIDRNKGRGGAPGQYLTIKAFEGEQPIMDYGSRRLIIWSDFVRVEGLHLIMPWRCDAFGEGIQIVNNTFTGPQPKFGAIETGGTNILIEGNTIQLTSGGNTRDHGIYVHAGNNITVRNNIITGFEGYGIHIFDQDDGEVLSNYVIENNFIKGSTLRAGIIVAKQGNVTINNIVLRNNISVNNAWYGIFLREGTNIKVFNNTFDNNSLESIRIDNVSNAEIKNNILSDKSGSSIVLKVGLNAAASNLDVKNNLYFNTEILGIEQNPIIGNPLFINPDGDDYSLQSGSPAIDAGIDVGLPFAGAAPDLGAFEFGLATGAPAAPALSSPADNATDISTTPTLVWNASSGAATYQLQVSTVSDFSTIELDQSGLTQTSFPVTTLLNNTVHYWRVKATNATGTSGWSPIWQFATVGTGGAPGAPALSSPADKIIDISTTPTFVWNASGGATTYQLQVSTVSDFASIELDQSGLTETSFPVTGLSNNTIYFWRVKAINSIGTSPWSPIWQFTTVAAALAAPALSSPEDNATNQPVDLDLVWNAVTGALSYQVQIANESDFSGDIIGQSGLIQSSFHLSDLPRERTLYWRVSATNAVGTGPWSTVWQFTTEPVTSVETGSEIPVNFRLGQNFPNPFNPTTNIAFDLPKSEFVSLKVYTLLGTEVATLVSENLSAGKHTIQFDASTLSSGVFFYKLQTSSFVETRKMLLVR